MNSLHSRENINNEEICAKSEVATLINSSMTRESDVVKDQMPAFTPETTEGVSPKTDVIVKENRFKLKPEQSYKKETKASRLGKSTGRWTQKEHVLFIEGLKMYGKNWKKVENFIGTRTGTQIRSHAQKFFNRIKKEHSTEDPSKFVIENMCDETIKRLVREHCGDDLSISNYEKDSSSDTPEMLFSITKEKATKRKRDDVDFTSRSIGSQGSAFKSFKRMELDVESRPEDSKIHGNNTILKKPI
jgi:SHAQKYF class myb-like DNA-binding protein